MANPSHTTRQTPTGIMIPVGFRTKVTLSLDPDLEAEEVEVKPSGFDNGEGIPQDSMWSNPMRVVFPRPISDTTPLTYICRYDPSALHSLKGMVGVRKSGATAQVCTETHYDGTQRSYYAYVKSAEPDNLNEGSDGKMTITIQPTNWDPINNVYAEAVTTSVAGS